MKAQGIQTIGKRKTSVARVYLRNGSGSITVNRKPLEEYFGGATGTLRMILLEPLVITNSREKYDIIINVTGGGKSGQAGAVRHGVARALNKANEEDHTTLKKAGFLTRDDREVERKKYGRHKARKRPQFSKR